MNASRLNTKAVRFPFSTNASCLNIPFCGGGNNEALLGLPGMTGQHWLHFTSVTTLCVYGCTESKLNHEICAEFRLLILAVIPKQAFAPV